MGSLVASIEQKISRPVQIICPLDETKGLLGPNDVAVRGEEEAEEKLKDAKIIVADPLYHPICPEGCQFCELPHIAFSGRIYVKRLLPLAEM